MVSGKALREEDVQLVERALLNRHINTSLARSEISHSLSPCPTGEIPIIKVKASARFLSIIIPEGVKLPLVTTIHSAGAFETQMSQANVREGSEASENAEAGPLPQRGDRPATISEQATGSFSQNESQDISAGLVLPFLARVSKGRLNVSEASLSTPITSDVSAQGHVFVPTHHQPSDEESEPVDAHAEKEGPEVVTATGQPDQSKDTDRSPSTDSVSSSRNSANVETASGGSDKGDEHRISVSGPASKLIPRSDNVIGETTGFPSWPEPREENTIPEIKLHRPSGTIMPASLGTSAILSTSVPGIPVQTPVAPTPEEVATAPLGNVPAAIAAGPVPASIPLNPSAMTTTIPIDVVSSALPIPNLGSLTSAGKVGKRRKMIRKARGLVVRKPVLSILIGRDLANVVHPQVKQISTATGIPLPVDGPSDLIAAFSMRHERRRDAQRREADWKIAVAKLHAEAEGLDRCQRCQGVLTTRYLRKYHRLQIKRERPGMTMRDRHATVMARVAAAKCKCPKGSNEGGRSGPTVESATVENMPADAPAGGAPRSGLIGRLGH